MYVKVCSLCKSKVYSATKENQVVHKVCKSYKKFETRKIQDRPFRTSTPVPETEKVSSNFSDSVRDFFYQTWKSGLRSETIGEHSFPKEQTNWQPMLEQEHQVIMPFNYISSHVFYVNAEMYYSGAPSTGIYLQPVGYRQDGTFGVLPFYWPCIVY